MAAKTAESQLFLHEYQSTAETIVREGGAIARELFGQVEVIGDHGQGNVFTKGDVDVNEHLCHRISQAFPEHDVLSEESGQTGVKSEYRWILDPIDGTRYFHGGVPLYSISLALQQDGQTVIGIVYNPETDQMFSAISGLGATLNTQPIRVSVKQRLEDCTVCLELPHRRMPESIRDTATHAVTTLMGQVERVRVLGASALGLCYCASGAFDLFLSLSTGSKEWDIAAGSLVLQEAGAAVRSYGKYTAAGAPALLDQLLQQLPAVTKSEPPGPNTQTQQV